MKHPIYTFVAIFVTGLCITLIGVNMVIADNEKTIATAYAIPTGTATPVPTPIVTSLSTRMATGAVVEKAVILYASKSGKREWPCTKKKPCDVATGIVKKNERVFARTVIFQSLTDAEILQIMRD